MAGIALFNSIVVVFGLVLMYTILPDTENKTLEEIELHFSDNSKKITDRKIQKIDTKPEIGTVRRIQTNDSNRKSTDNDNRNWELNGDV